MSYDYNALVSSIATARRHASSATQTPEQLQYLQQAAEGFETLSSHCPMTPLLWIQYARTTHDLILCCSATTSSSPEYDSSSTGGLTSAAVQQEATELQLQTLELGLQEFPGSCLLQLYHVRQLFGLLHSSSSSSTASELRQRTKEALEAAMDAVGKGSHRNEDHWVAVLYQLQAHLGLLMLQNDDTPTANRMIQKSFVDRSRIPMKDANDSLVADYQEFCHQHDVPASSDAVEAIECGRRLEARVYSPFRSLEDDIDVAMHQEGILARHLLTTPVVPKMVATTTTGDEWEQQLVDAVDHRFGMGLGGAATAQAFIRYALALVRASSHHHNSASQKRKRVDDHDDLEQLEMEQGMSHLALAVYERGIAECPTVESIWLSYIRCLLEMLPNQSRPKASEQPGNVDSASTALAVRLQSVVQRAVRNCPYSQALVEQQLHTVFVLAQHGLAVLDPDRLLEIVQTAIDKQFLPGPAPFLALYVQAIRIVKRRILHLLTQTETSPPTKKRSNVNMAEASSRMLVTFDEPEALPLKQYATPSNLDDDVIEEVGDLLEDLTDMLDQVEARLQKSHGSWSEGRALLWRERAHSELLLLNPLKLVFSAETDEATARLFGNGDDAVSSFERCILVHNPPHPESYLSYIRQYTAFTPTKSAVDVSSKLRRVRFLYQKGVNSVGRPKTWSAPQITQLLPGFSFPDFDKSLSNLCQEWIDFEYLFGSDRSIGRARKAIERKVQKVGLKGTSPRATAAQTASPNEEKVTPSLDEENVTQSSDVGRPAKKPKTDESLADVDIGMMPVETVEHPDSKPKYKAHPFTIRVSNLDLTTQDMDLVDAFRVKCGAVVHAKIMREKHQHQKGQSKGWGLVQFEERESVNKALALDGVLGIHEKLINVEPSHMPAVTLVPPGMHLVNPKGEGKNSKRNQIRKEHKKNLDQHPTASADSSATTGVGPSSEEKTPVEKPDNPQKTPKPKDSILAFRPRGLGRHQKIQLDLKGKKPKPP